MTSEAPPNVGKPWMLSDVVLHTNNSGGKDIYACKTALAMFSPYFRLFFFGNFKQNGEAAVKVDCDYDIMLEILKNIHQVNFNYCVMEPYSPEMIVKIYRAADKFGFAFIRKMCADQMEGYANMKMAKAAGDLQLFYLKRKIWIKLTREDLHKFLYLPDHKYSLSKEEFRFLFEKIVGRPLPKATEPYCTVILNLEEITEDLENPRVDLTQSWPGANLEIITTGTQRRVLYANKTVVETMCQNLHKYLCTTDEHKLEDSKEFLASIGEHYVTVKEILSLIHNCNTHFRKERVLHPVLLYDMYCLAWNEHLDIPFVRDWCVAKLIEHKSVDAVDALATLRLTNNLKEALEMLSTSQLRGWIQRHDEHLCYRDGSIGVTITPSTDKQILNEELTCWLFKMFKEEFFPGTYYY